MPRSVFWPRDCTRNGVFYGWTKPAICIAGVIENVSNAEDIADKLEARLANSKLWLPLNESCGGNPTLLGHCEFSANKPIPSSLKFWNLGNTEPTYSIILYARHPPHALRYYVLELPSREQVPPPTPSTDPYAALANHDFTHRKPTNVDQAINEIVINQLNACSVLQTVAHDAHRIPKLLPTTATILLTLAAHSTILSPLLLIVCKIIASFANLPVVSFGVQSPSTYLRLKDVSAVVQQLDVRVEQTIFFTTQVSTLRRQNTRNIPSYATRYTNFFNTVWLIMNDIIIGLAVGTFLLDNSDALADICNRAIQTYLFHIPRSILFWLDSWPAGLKLNTQLSTFYAATLVGSIDTWNALMQPLQPSWIRLLGTLSCIGGFTLLLSLLSDLLCLVLTAHLRLGYELTRAVYWAAGVKLGGGLLWGVFRGKRRNVLRNRTDAWSYDMDQLLFGSVLFTLVAFLFPTALVYYTLFAVVRLATLLLQACIETALAFMHHFPLFALMLLVKDPGRLPGNVYFTLDLSTLDLDQGSKRNVSPAYLVLQNQPITLSAIFFQYIELSRRLARHYNPLRLLYLVLSGQHLESIPRYSIRYAPTRDSVVDKEKTE